MSKTPPSIGISCLVNPPEEGTKITLEQLWKALEMKVRQPQLFLTSFTSCEVVSDDGDKVVRKALSQTGAVVDETCYLYKPTMIYFEGTIRVNNIVSYNQAGELILTYTFVNGVPGVPPAAAGQQEETREKAIQIATSAVQHTLAQIRGMIKEGKL